MNLRTALVAVLCSAMLSVGLAVGLGAGGSAEAAGTGPALNQIKSELKKANKTLGSIDNRLDDANRALGEPTFLSQNITDLLQEICSETPGTIC